MASCKISIKKDGKIIQISNKLCFFHFAFGLIFLLTQITLILSLLNEWNGNKSAFVFKLFIVCFFSAVFYIIASWWPFYLSLEKDKERKLLTFLAIPGCLRKKTYPLAEIFGFLVEDDGDGLTSFYVLGKKKHKLFTGYDGVVSDLASKAAEVFNLTVERR